MGCVIAMAAIVIMVIFCKKKEKGTRVVEIRSNGNTQVHTITSMHPAPGPPGQAFTAGRGISIISAEIRLDSARLGHQSGKASVKISRPEPSLCRD